jgi:hypothetical protein
MSGVRMHLSRSARKLPKPATIDLIEVRRLVYSCRNPGRAFFGGALTGPVRPIFARRVPRE